jgi:hypothetical protein
MVNLVPRDLMIRPFYTEHYFNTSTSRPSILLQLSPSQVWCKLPMEGSIFAARSISAFGFGVACGFHGHIQATLAFLTKAFATLFTLALVVKIR